MKKIFLSIVLCGMLLSASAQERISLNWLMHQPLGSTADYIGTFNVRGFDFQYRYLVNPNIGVGFDVGFNAWYEKQEAQTYVLTDATTVNATFYNYINTWNLHAAGDYYFGSSSAKVQPSAGLALGVSSVSLETQVVDYILTDYNNWPFSISPNVGVAIAIPGSGAAFNLNAFYTFTTYDYKQIINNLNYVGFRVGITWL
ncbi:MAG: hypothetical protein IPG60_07455 [Bacteroidetes bacterium]|nr:hypothetical protein [Bacteroidota bacterium]MBP7399902.1 hypothetical protein [Chitinophagales bacterium]MBK7110597.1 hypothetical protein [Bacteroidota bacterium]MBK8488181.1 hypothetical protein [Bacteroidota bacterium]MBK8682058.1 hypothetical protein [Bacteroidota bacterium]